MFKIGVFSNLVRVSARMLRHYEKCGLLYPAKVDKVKGYRYYSASQIPLVTRITTLRDIGFTIEEISDLLDSFEDKIYLEKALAARNEIILANIELEHKRLSNLNLLRKQMEAADYMSPNPVIVKSIPSYKVMSLRQILPDYSFQQELWQKMFQFVEENSLHSNLQGEIICVYHSEEYTEKNVELDIAVTVNELFDCQPPFVCRETEPIPLAATAVFEGYYDNLALWEGVLAEWIETNGYEMVGNERVFGIKHPLNETDFSKFKTEVQFPIQKIRSV